MANWFISKFKQKFGKSTGGKGFTLMEVVVSVAVIAVLSGIMIPSVISINNSLTNRQADDYAKSIYMAAQTQLSTLKAAQPKALSVTLSTSAVGIPRTGNAELESAWNSDLRYAVSGRDQDFFDNVLLPPGSIDDTLRNKKIMIEYNSLTGEVYSVFFLNEPATAEDHLTYGDVARSVAERKAIHLGYYQAKTSSDVTLPETYTEDLFECEILSFYNNYDSNGDGVITVLVPIPEGYEDTMQFADSLAISITITGKTSGAKKVIDLTGDVSGRKNKLTATDLSVDGRPAVGFSYILDSVYTPSRGFDKLVENSGFQIGENVILSVEITDTSDVTTFEGTPKSLSINPLYAELSGGTLEVANARNLQNLNKYATSDAVSEVNLSDSFDWYGDKVFAPLKNECGFQEFNGNGKTISGLTINDSTISGNSVGLFTALTASDKDNKPVIKDLTLDKLTINLDHSEGKSVGAIVGSATDVTVSNCAATDISFTLDETNASTCVGGLVGVMRGGTLKGDESGTATTVSGTITKKSGKVEGYYVGGAVGKDEDGAFSVGSNIDRAVYSKVNASVELKSWGGSASAASAGDPSGLGVNVGKFIGYVDSGAFSDCSGTGESDQPYQFLGQIAYEITHFPLSSTAYKINAPYFDETPTVSDTAKVEQLKSVGTLISESSVNLAQYSANLTRDNKCLFSDDNGNQYYQLISSLGYYQSGIRLLPVENGTLEYGKDYYFVSYDGQFILSTSGSGKSSSAVIKETGGSLNDKDCSLTVMDASDLSKDYWTFMLDGTKKTKNEVLLYNSTTDKYLVFDQYNAGDKSVVKLSDNHKWTGYNTADTAVKSYAEINWGYLPTADGCFVLCEYYDSWTSLPSNEGKMCCLSVKDGQLTTEHSSNFTWIWQTKGEQQYKVPSTNTCKFRAYSVDSNPFSSDSSGESLTLLTKDYCIGKASV